MAYPKLKQVKPKLKTAIRPSNVKRVNNISIPSFYQISIKDFYINRGSQSLRRGLTAYPNMVAPRTI